MNKYDLNDLALVARKPVWNSFLALIPMGEESLNPEEVERLAAPLAESPFSRRELWRIFWDEVLPTWNQRWPEAPGAWAQLHPLCERAAGTSRALRWLKGIVCAALMLFAVVVTLLGVLNPLLLLVWRWAEIVRDASRLIAKAGELRAGARARQSQ